MIKDLLILLSNYPYNNSDKQSIANLLSTIADWPKTIELLNAHGIIAIAAYNIESAGLSHLIPPAFLRVIDNGQKLTITRNLWLVKRWKEVNDILINAGIKHILLKGMALEYTIYDGRGLRQMSDNDILINKDESIKAWDILRKNGYVAPLTKSKLHKGLLTQIGYHLPPLIKDGYIIEIHHRLFINTINNSECFDNAREIFIEGTKAYILQDEIHLKFLKNHLQKHIEMGEYQLRLSNDIRLLSKEDFPYISENLIMNPFQKIKKDSKKAYKSVIHSLSIWNKLKYILGDTFPSLKWMKKRYNCRAITAILIYPVRLGKLLWLL